jgi:hypothetical protein
MKTIRRMEPAASSRAASVVVTAPGARISLHWVLQIVLACTFVMGLAQYSLSSGTAAFLPLVGIGICALLVLSGRRRTARVQNILGGGGLLFAAMLFGEAISYTSHDKYSEFYGLVFLGIFLCARLIVQEIGVANVVRAYSHAAILSVCIVLINGRRTLLAGESARFNGGTRAHPNLVGFVLAGFLPVLIWRAVEEKTPWKTRVLIGLSLLSFLMVFFTGSRGSLSALLIAGIALLLRGIGTGWLQKLRLRHLHVIVLVILIPLTVMFLLQHNRIVHIADYVVDFLALNTTQRGLKSGLSGRTGIWQIAFRLLAARDRWLFGFGYRTGDLLVGTIDNGYIQLLFESGLIAGGLIFGSMVRVFFVLWKASSCRVNNAWNRYYLMLWCLMIVYFLNNISTRYLFSFGSPFSLLVLFLMAASRRELVGGDPHAVVHPPTSSPRPASRAVAWDRSSL